MQYIQEKFPQERLFLCKRTTREYRNQERECARDVRLRREPDIWLLTFSPQGWRRATLWRCPRSITPLSRTAFVLCPRQRFIIREEKGVRGARLGGPESGRLGFYSPRAPATHCLSQEYITRPRDRPARGSVVSPISLANVDVTSAIDIRDRNRAAMNPSSVSDVTCAWIMHHAPNLIPS